MPLFSVKFNTIIGYTITTKNSTIQQGRTIHKITETCGQHNVSAIPLILRDIDNLFFKIYLLIYALLLFILDSRSTVAVVLFLGHANIICENRPADYPACPEMKRKQSPLFDLSLR